MSESDPRLLSVREADPVPSISVAIPHYQHRRHLEKVLMSVLDQDFEDMEIVVSDDGSPDDSNSVIPQMLASAGRAHRYYAQEANLGYDGNLRFVISASLGRYVFVLGNDDALASPQTLSRVFESLRSMDFPEVAFTDYASWADPREVTRRSTGTKMLGAGPETALRNFRSLSFVSGLIFDRAASAGHETDRWDRSIYYQMYLGSRIVAAGGRMASISIPAVLKDIEIDGKHVVTYETKWANQPRSFKSRHSGLDSVIRVNAAAILPYVEERRHSQTVRRIVNQLLLTTYPYWVFEYRTVARWSFAVGIARGMRPSGFLREYELTSMDRFRICLIYLAATLAALTLPVRAFKRVDSRLASLAKILAQRS